MKSIEDIVSDFLSLSPASPGRWNTLALVSSRLHLTRGPDGNFAIFLEGSLESFGHLPPVPGIDHAVDITALPSSRRFDAVRIATIDGVTGNRAIAHVAYELQRRLTENPSEPNESLLAQIQWVLVLLGSNSDLMGADRQRGLIGECLLLRRLLMKGRSLDIEPIVALRRWWGSYPTKRDFSAVGVAIEVKTTGYTTRLHHVSSIEQLDPSPGERVYVFSVGLRSDLTSARKFPDFVADVRAQLVDAKGDSDELAVRHFEEQLKRYGYDSKHEAFYRSGPGYLRPHLSPALFDERALRRLRWSDLRDQKLPDEVAAIGYTLHITSGEISDREAESIYEKILSAPAVSHD